ncbi:MAG: hypothetical protein HC848_03110 [Limnobacter sp.]|nr:hypothetical protein [Limnobacter sp.]
MPEVDHNAQEPTSSDADVWIPNLTPQNYEEPHIAQNPTWVMENLIGRAESQQSAAPSQEKLPQARVQQPSNDSPQPNITLLSSLQQGVQAFLYMSIENDQPTLTFDSAFRKACGGWKEAQEILNKNPAVANWYRQQVYAGQQQTAKPSAATPSQRPLPSLADFESHVTNTRHNEITSREAIQTVLKSYGYECSNIGALAVLAALPTLRQGRDMERSSTWVQGGHPVFKALDVFKTHVELKLREIKTEQGDIHENRARAIAKLFKFNEHQDFLVLSKLLEGFQKAKESSPSKNDPLGPIGSRSFVRVAAPAAPEAGPSTSAPSSLPEVERPIKRNTVRIDSKFKERLTALLKTDASLTLEQAVMAVSGRSIQNAQIIIAQKPILSTIYQEVREKTPYRAPQAAALPPPRVPQNSAAPAPTVTLAAWASRPGRTDS